MRMKLRYETSFIKLNLYFISDFGSWQIANGNLPNYQSPFDIRLKKLANNKSLAVGLKCLIFQ